jgi:hypothetical protein
MANTSIPSSSGRKRPACPSASRAARPSGGVTEARPRGGVDPVFCEEETLGYASNRTRFEEGAPLRLDDSYRLAHLPLLRPGHPRALRSAPGRPYMDGTHETMWSVVLPVDAEALERSAPMRELEAELRAAPFAEKIAWDLLPRRRDVLHATVCGGMGSGPPPLPDERTLDALAAIGPVEIELRGLFSGNVNHGRLYLPVYPEARSPGANPIQSMQRALGRAVTDLWLVGLYNLLDDLTVAETEALAALIDRRQGVPLLRFTATELWLLGARDDLVLDGDPPIELALTR